MNSKNGTNSPNLAHWNANGLNNECEELKDFILGNNIDMILVNVMKFTNTLDTVWYEGLI